MTQNTAKSRAPEVFPAARTARRLWFDPSTLVWVTIAVILTILVVVPLSRLVVLSFRPTGQDVGWTFAQYLRAFGDPLHLKPILNTAIICFATSIFSTLIGAIVAWGVTRTDIPGDTFLRTSVLASFVMPPFLGAIAWILLAGPNAGLLNRLYRWGFGFTEGHIFDIFTLSGVVFAMVLYTYPLAFIVIYAALNAVASDVEDAANIAGASTLATMFQITLPLVAPALIAGYILSFLEAMILFGVPAMLALPARMHVMTTQLRTFLLEDIPATELAAAYSVPMLLAAVALLWVRKMVLGRRGYATIGGKGGQRRKQKLGRWRWPLFGFCILVVASSLFLPYFILVSASFMVTWSRGFEWANFTLGNYPNVLFLEHETLPTIANTLKLAFMSATAGAFIASVVAYVSHRKLVRGYQYLSFLATAPLAIPGIVLAVGLFATYARPPFLLYGTIWIIFLAYLTKFMPVAFQTCYASIQSIHPELEESCRILGANRLTVFKDVTLPLFKLGVISAWVLIFMPSLRELSSSILLYTNRSSVLSVLIYEYYEEGIFEKLSTLGVLLLVITFTVIALAYRFMGRDFMKA